MPIKGSRGTSQLGGETHGMARSGKKASAPPRNPSALKGVVEPKTEIMRQAPPKRARKFAPKPILESETSAAAMATAAEGLILPPVAPALEALKSAPPPEPQAAAALRGAAAIAPSPVAP